MTLNRTLLKRLLIIVSAIFALGVVALGVLIASQWTLLDRIRNHPEKSIIEVNWYTPKEAVRGGGGVPLPRLSPEESPFREEALEKAAKLADTKNASALLVVHDGRVAFERHWRGHAPEVWTNSASMAKTITALLIGIALDDGRIRSLDEPAATWLPAWRRDARKKITLRHLLQMHAGLRPMGDYDDLSADAIYLALGTDLHGQVDSVPAVIEPGTQFDYNNVNFQALGFVLEAATGKHYAEYLSEKLWEPLGAADAALWLDRKGGSARTFGYLFATTDDWAKVGLLFLNRGRWNGRTIVSEDYLDQMLIPSPTEPRYGLGIWLANNAYQAQEEEETFLADGVYYLDGRMKQRVYIDSSHSLVLVRVGENGRGWDEAALLNAVLRGLKPGR